MYPCVRHRAARTLVPRDRVLAVIGKGGIRIRGGFVEITAEQYGVLIEAIMLSEGAGS
jgi:hypothetical protein